MTSLKQYCELFSGYSFRNPLIFNKVSTTGVIQLKDVDASSRDIMYTGWSNIQDFSGSDKYYLRDSDVLLISKGPNNTAFIYKKNKSNYSLTLAAGAFIILRPMESYLDSAYLTWYLNLQESQAIFKRGQVKTTVHNLSIDVAYEFQIEIPPLQKQQSIGELYLLNQEFQRTSREREEKRIQLLNQQLKLLL